MAFEARNSLANSALDETDEVLDVGALVVLAVFGGRTVDFLLNEVVEFLFILVVVSPTLNDGIEEIGWDKERGGGWGRGRTDGSRVSRR